MYTYPWECRSTVPAPATFLPVQTTLPEGEYLGTGGSDPVSKRKRTLDLDVSGDLAGDKISSDTGGVYGVKYPKGVKW